MILEMEQVGNEETTMREDGGLKRQSVKLLRFDLEVEEPKSDECIFSQDIPQEDFPVDRDDLFAKFGLPSDSIVKLNYSGKFIPWSLIGVCPSIEIRVYRPHQFVKPKQMQDFNSDYFVKERLSHLENRIKSLEAEVDQKVIETKTKRDIQCLSKQVAILGKKFEFADKHEWIKKP